MKSGWETKNLGDVLKLEYGKPLQKEHRKPNGRYPVYGANGEKTRSDKFYFDKPSIIVGRKGSAGEANLSEEKFWPLDVAYFVTFDEKQFDLLFLYFLLIKLELPKMAKGVKPGINRNDVYSLEVSIPPLPEQQRIVRLLDEAFDALATATAHAETNLRNARELFESYLRSAFAQSGDSWKEAKFGDVCGFVRGPFGGSLKKSIFVPDGYAVYEQRHAIYNQFSEIRYFIDENKFEEMRRFELFSNDLIMSCSGTMGRVAIVPEGIKSGIINQALLKLTPSENILPIFLKYWMESESFQDALKEYSGGAAIQNVASVKILKNIKVPLPPVTEQKELTEKLDAFHAKTQHLESIYECKLAALAELKQYLLNQAFNGEL